MCRRHRLIGDPHDVVLGLLGRQAHAGRLRVCAEPPRLGILRAVYVAHPAGPDATRRPQLRDLLEEVRVDVEEEREARGERVDIEPARDSALYVLEAVAQGERELLCGRGARLTDVVTRNRDRVVLRGVLRAPLEHVDDAAQRGLRWEDPGMLCLVLLQDVVLDGAPEHIGRDPLFLRGGDVETEEDDRGPVDRHGHRHAIQRDPLEEPLHVGERRDRDATDTHLA